MIPDPGNFNTIIGYASHWFETRLLFGNQSVIGVSSGGNAISFGDLNGPVILQSDNMSFGNDRIKSLKIERNVFQEDTMCVGGAVSAELTATILLPTNDSEKPTFPKMCPIIVETRVCGYDSNGDIQQSGWAQTGKFFTDTKKYSKNDDGLDMMEITAYDAMMRAEKIYNGDGSTTPLPIVQRCRTIMGGGTGIEGEPAQQGGTGSGTYLLLSRRSSGDYVYTYQNLHKNYSVREVLKIIAASFGGNFIINYEGKIKLIR